MAEERLDFLYQLADELERDEDFDLPYRPLSPVLCFRFLPKALAHLDAEARNQVQAHIRKEIQMKGLSLFNIADIRGSRYFRFILINPLATQKEMERSNRNLD